MNANAKTDATEPGVFLSHTARDKPFVRRLATDLVVAGARVWIDEAEIGIGESLIAKIGEGIEQMDYLAVILSPASVQSAWVQREVDLALNHEIQGRRVKVLPLLLEQCALPAFLVGKKYANFTDPDLYLASLADVLSQIGLAAQQSAGQYDYSFFDGARRFRALSERAKQLLRQAGDAQPRVFTIEWDETSWPRRIRTLRIGSATIDVGQQIDEWTNAVRDLERHWLVQTVASRPGYTAYKVTPDGWDLVKFVGRSA